MILLVTLSDVEVDLCDPELNSVTCIIVARWSCRNIWRDMCVTADS